jgi:hypothetical protein
LVLGSVYGIFIVDVVVDVTIVAEESLHATKAKIKKFFPSKSERRRLYMHASPPCQLLSSMNNCRLIVAYDVRDTAGKKNAQQLIDYYSKYCYSDSVKIIPEPGYAETATTD